MKAARDKSRTPRQTQVPGGSLEEIAQIINERQTARYNKDYILADTYRDQLKALGVTLFDKTNQWSAEDGRSGRMPTFMEISSGRTDILGQNGEAGEEDAEQIKLLVEQREQARASKDFDTSDRLREELRALGVEVYDKEKIWKSNGGLSGVITGYHETGGPTVVEITTLVSQREKARQDNDWKTADMIRDQLKERGVNILDKEKVWKADDGRSGLVPHWSSTSAAAASLGAATQSFGGAATQSFGRAPPVQNLMKAAQANLTNPLTAARTMELLRQAALPAGSTAPAQDEFQQATSFVQSRKNLSINDEEINWLLGVREKLRKNKDFPSSDHLRMIMKTQLGFEFFEKEQRWSLKDGREGPIPTWTGLN